MLIKILIFLCFMTITLFGCSLPQTANQSSQQANQSNQMAQELKTTRLLIDGFVKSKSGAI